MKYTIHGFSQLKLIDLGLDNNDALILRYFVDFQGTNKMVTYIKGGKVYYWVNYKSVIDELPILKLTKPDSVYRRFRKLSKCKVLEHTTKKDASGTYSFYKFGEKYESLISWGKDFYPDGYGTKSRTKDSNIKDPKTKLNLHFLWENDMWEEWQEEYISVFLTIRNNYISKQHKRISSSNVKYIKQVIQSFSNNNIDIEVFKEGVNTYFSNLDKDNDGDIVYFMQICQKRIFDIDYKDVVKK